MTDQAKFNAVTIKTLDTLKIILNELIDNGEFYHSSGVYIQMRELEQQVDKLKELYL